ncbi:MAG: SMC-Scp complex subunit ScpB [Bermanella sp.]
MVINDILLEQIVEGALLASGQTLSVDRIQNLFEDGMEPSAQRILITLERLSEKCQNRGYELQKVATGYRFQVKQECSKWVSRLWEEKPQRYSRALLETLSIIAYRQPVTRGEIENVRGVAVSSHITKTLIEREWIQVVGHRDVPGRPSIFATTKMFLDYFNLSSLDQLPTLEEIQEITDANHALELEDKVEEGNFDFSSKESEDSGEDTLASAALDLEAADALVQSVEDAVFNKPEEDEEAQSSVEVGQTQLPVEDLPQPAISEGGSGSSENEVPAEQVPSIEEAEALITKLDESISAQQDAEEASKIGGEELDEEALAQATIARMIAEQEALLNAKASADGVASNPKPSQDSEVASETKQVSSGSVFDDFNTEVIETPKVKPQAKSHSVFDDFEGDNYDSGAQQGGSGSATKNSLVAETVAPESLSEDDSVEDELMAAMEDEMMAQLEDEQAQLLTGQTESNDENASKTLSDLASKFE